MPESIKENLSSEVKLNGQVRSYTFPRLVLFGCVCVLPACLAVTYLGFQVHQSWQQDIAQANQTLRKQKELQSKPKVSPVEYLNYPEFESLKLLSEYKLAQQLVATEQDSSILQPENVSSRLTESNEHTPTSTEQQPSIYDDLPMDNWDLNSLDLSGLSPELASKVQGILDEETLLDQGQLPEVDKNNEGRTFELVNYSDKFKGQLPAMNLQTHMYSSREQGRWVKINGVELHEGDWLNKSIQLLTITPRYITIGFEGDIIEIPALYEWQG
ncbi:general secretion pathway protein GspB [Vibrio sp. MA40-2]|uniref:general secretion pathway protein GspB n=1 Tax=Vibrio sp. MA40-2 TaxID=3391828 RepID=UPI0039A48748